MEPKLVNEVSQYLIGCEMWQRRGFIVGLLSTPEGKQYETGGDDTRTTMEQTPVHLDVNRLKEIQSNEVCGGHCNP